MGSTLSSFWLASKSFCELTSLYSTLIKRISISPGIPLADTTPSFWSKNEALLDIPLPNELPNYADVVIIGSGITGAAVAHTLLSRSDKFGSIIMVDARSICSGATGRNGGHCKGETWGDYGYLRDKYGEDGAQRIQRFRRTSLKDLMDIDQKYCKGKGDVRNVETLDCFYKEDLWVEAKQKLKVWREAMEENGKQKPYTHDVYEGVDAQKKWNVSSHCTGIIWSKANMGALNSYRLVTTLLQYLTQTYSERFSIFPHTPILSIADSLDSEGSRPCYILQTSRGPIKTCRIIHGTNAHCSHLIPSLRSKVVPFRLSVSVQRPGLNFLPTCTSGMRSWCLYYGKGFDFVAQLPKSPDMWGDGELLYGGGVIFANNSGVDEAGNLDESAVDPQLASYLAGALPVYFGEENWGPEGRPDKDDKDGWGEGRVKTTWSGMMGFSADGPPWVGKLPRGLTARKANPQGGGEWLSAGFSGEGMVHAWGCGRACGMMVLGLEDREGEELPKEFLITKERVRKSNTQEMFTMLEQA